MNWTEGNLARHSRGRKGKEVILRQREHFAKVRSRLLNDNAKINPPSISFLARPAHSSSPSRHLSVDPKPSVPSTSKKRARENSLIQTSRYFEDVTLELPSPADFQRDHAEEEALRQKRRKLLLKGDWVGTDVQKPILMEFSKPRASSRENPWGTSRPNYRSSKTRLRHLLGIRASDGQIRASEAATKVSTPVSRSQLRVRVGSRERALGESSNAGPHSSPGRDVEAGLQASHIRAASHHRELRQSAYHGHESAESDSYAYDSSEEPSQGPISTTSPLLYHPVPHRPPFAQPLPSQSSDSDKARSTKARVAVRRPDVPSSQMEQNEAWLDFVRGAECDHPWSDPRPSDDQESTPQREISPGISQRGLYDHPSHPNEKQDSAKRAQSEEDDCEGRADKDASAQLLAEALQYSQHGTVADGISQDDYGIGSPIQSSPGSLDVNLAESAKSPQTIDDTAQEKVKPPYEDSDEVCLLVFPSSPSVSCRDIPDNLALHQDQAFDTEEIIQPPQQDPQSQNETSVDKAVPTADQPAEKEKRRGSMPVAFEDENDMWRQFILGEYKDSLEQALGEAIRETARNLRPSDTSTSSDENCASDDPYPPSHSSEMPGTWSENVTVDVRDFAAESEQSATDVSIVASASHRATVAYSSPDPLSEPMPAYMDTTIHTDQATAGSSTSSLVAPQDNMTEFMRRSDAWSLATADSEDASLIACAPSLRNPCGEDDDNFKFAPPKPFLGRKTSHLDEQRQIALSASQIRGRPVTWRRQRRTGDGRTSIRKLPAYSSDPIEEVEDDVPVKRTEKSSLFCSLDMAEDFEA